jgi:hypothetical protein
MIARGRRREAGAMNKLESAYAQMLEARRIAGEVAWWRYEPAKFRLTDGDKLTTLTPDFMVMLASGELEVHETKGFMEGDAAVKLKVFADQYPFRVYLVKHPNKSTGWVIKAVGN